MHGQGTCGSAADAAAAPPQSPPVPRAVLRLVWQGKAEEAAAACRAFPAIRASLQRELEASRRAAASPPATYELPEWAVEALATWPAQGPALQLKSFMSRPVSDAGCANQTQLSLKLSEKERREVVRRLRDLCAALPPQRQLLRLVLADRGVAGQPPPCQQAAAQQQQGSPPGPPEQCGGEDGPLVEVREHNQQTGKRRAFYLICSKLPRTDQAALLAARRRQEQLSTVLQLAAAPEPAPGAEQPAADTDPAGPLEPAAPAMPAPAVDDTAALPLPAPAPDGDVAPPRQRRPLARRNLPPAAAGTVPSKRSHAAAGEENATAAPVAAQERRRAALLAGNGAGASPAGGQAGRRARATGRMPR